MAFEITEKARIAAEKVEKRPQLVLQIDGVTQVFGAIGLKKYVRIGDPGLLIDGTWRIGGTIEHPDSSPYITFEKGTTSVITQDLDQFSGRGSTVSSMSVTLIDKNKEITNLISPGKVVTDVLGRDAKIWLGFDNTGWPDDFIIIFRGIIDDISAGAGYITLRVAHPDQKKRSEILPKVSTELTAPITDSDTIIPLASTANLIPGPVQVGAEIDESFESYVRIDDEIIFFNEIVGNELRNCIRGQLGTTAKAHDQGATVESFYRLKGNAIDLALKLMLSNTDDPGSPYAQDISVTNFVRVDAEGLISNAIFFRGLNIKDEHGVVIGDACSISGATNPENNFGGIISDVQVVDGGSYIIVTPAGGGSYVEEIDSAAAISFTSKYSTLPVGLGLKPNEVDVEEHERIFRLFLSSFEYDFYLKDTVNAKEFIEKEIYMPAAAFSLPRKSRASIGYHIGPIPGTRVKTLDSSNVLNASDLRIRRSITKNFYNSIVYKYEELALEEKFIRGVITVNEDSTTRIPVGNKVLNIESKGLRQALNAEILISNANDRRLNKYKFGAEFIDNVKLKYETGFDLEIGDIVILDLESLQLTDTVSGTRRGAPRLFEIENKRLDIKTGEISVNLVDTNFDINARYGLISPASRVKAGVSTSQFVIRKTGNSEFGINEYRKWEPLIGCAVVVRSPDYSVFDTSTIKALAGNTVTLSSALSFTPETDYIMELDVYENQPANVKLIYTFMSDTEFADGGKQYVMI